MPRRSTISQLPAEVRKWLEGELRKRGFAGYTELTVELNRRLAAIGDPRKVSRTAVNEFGQEIEDGLAALRDLAEYSKAMKDVLDDDEGAINDTLIGNAQLELMKQLKRARQNPDSVDVTKLTRSIAELGHASIRQKKHQIEVKALKAAAARVEETARKSGLSREVIDELKREMLGVAA